jgi:hypothetical protein
VLLPAKMLETLNLFESRHWMKELNPHGTEDRSPVKKEEVSARSRMLHRVLDEVDDRVAFEFGETTKAKVA